MLVTSAVIEIITVLCHFVIQFLDRDVVAQQVKALAVRLPEKLEPRCQNGTVGSSLHVFTTDGTHQQAVTHAHNHTRQ